MAKRRQSDKILPMTLQRSLTYRKNSLSFEIESNNKYN